MSPLEPGEATLAVLCKSFQHHVAALSSCEQLEVMCLQAQDVVLCRQRQKAKLVIILRKSAHYDKINARERQEREGSNVRFRPASSLTQLLR